MARRGGSALLDEDLVRLVLMGGIGLVAFNMAKKGELGAELYQLATSIERGFSGAIGQPVDVGSGPWDRLPPGEIY